MSALGALLALILAVATFLAGLFFTGQVRKLRLRQTEPTPGLVGKYLANLRADLDDAGMEGISPVRALLYFVLAGVITGLAISTVLGLTLIGLVSAIVITFFFARDFYIGKRARKLRSIMNGQVAEAGREIADSVESGMAPLDALRSYSGRAAPDAASEAITGQSNRVARAFSDALARIERGMSTEEALRSTVDQLDNRFLSSLVEAYIQTSGIDAIQLVASLRRVSKEVDDAILLRDERSAAIAQPKNSNKIVGAVIFGILGIMNFMLPGSGTFFSSLIGQIFLIIIAGAWYGGNKFLGSGYEEDL